MNNVKRELRRDDVYVLVDRHGSVITGREHTSKAYPYERRQLRTPPEFSSAKQAMEYWAEYIDEMKVEPEDMGARPVKVKVTETLETKYDESN